MKPEWIAPHRTALILIDCQVDFGAPDGAMARAGADMSSVPPALAKAGALADAARSAKVDVVFIRLITRSGDDSKIKREARQRQEISLPDFCVEGSRGAEFIGPQPRSGETVISKTRFSAFAGTALADHLRARGIDTLVLAGLTTECCVQSSAWDALGTRFPCLFGRRCLRGLRSGAAPPYAPGAGAEWGDCRGR